MRKKRKQILLWQVLLNVEVSQTLSLAPVHLSSTFAFAFRLSWSMLVKFLECSKMALAISFFSVAKTSLSSRANGTKFESRYHECFFKFSITLWTASGWVQTCRYWPIWCSAVMSQLGARIASWDCSTKQNSSKQQIQ